ncbi:MAG TPA: class I SAM-dependent methyltransferase [Planctomycetota bacterium]|nr:class I SAM-dependent methyltransferase [Planctomycetota bacterium]
MSVKTRHLERVPEPEVMNDALEVRAYREADFRKVNLLCARRALRASGKRAGRALDLGTGPAEIPILLCQEAPGWRVTAVDRAPRMLEAARENVERHGLSRRITLLPGNACAMDGLRGRFDLVLSNSLLHHLRDPVPFWRQVKRLLGPGGAVMVQDLLRPASRAEARRLLEKHARDASPLLRSLFHQSLLAAFTPAEVRAQLRAAGLECLEVRRVSDRHLVVRGALE